MESGCHDCVGPIPTPEQAAAATTDEPAPSLVTLLPFGATDIRIGVMPVIWSEQDAVDVVQR
eukprot:SAG31_NODE_71_length_28115_cov_4.128105_16_plen_62_part_00